MILDTLANAERYYPLHPSFREAFEYLRKGTFAAGRHELKKTQLFALGDDTHGKGHEKVRLEAHKRYIDIQFAVDGNDEIGWRPTHTCKDIAVSYNEEKDILYYSDEPWLWMNVPKGYFAIFFPEDAHAPLAGNSPIKKIVMKIAIK